MGNTAGSDASDIGAVEVQFQSGTNIVVSTLAEGRNNYPTPEYTTLADALALANASPDLSVIRFAPALSGGTILNTTSVDGLQITSPVKIDGPGARLLTISGNDANRVFRIFNVPSGQEVLISRLRIFKGKTTGDGAGIHNSSTLRVINCTLQDNGLQGAQRGGGVFNATGATLFLEGCTLVRNNASAGGGGLRNHATATVKNCTFSANNSPAGGAGIFHNAGTMTVTNCTLASNTASASAGGPDCSGTFVSQGHNLLRDGSNAFGFTGPGDLLGTFASPINARFDNDIERQRRPNRYARLDEQQSCDQCRRRFSGATVRSTQFVTRGRERHRRI
jgi:hypothetical protein